MGLVCRCWRLSTLKAEQRLRGFTLLEVMIAMTIFAAIVIVISDTASQSVALLILLQDKILSAMVADNSMAELRLIGLPPLRERSVQTSMVGRDWLITSKVEKTEFPDTHRVTIEVADASNKDAIVATLASIMGKH